MKEGDETGEASCDEEDTLLAASNASVVAAEVQTSSDAAGSSLRTLLKKRTGNVLNFYWDNYVLLVLTYSSGLAVNWLCVKLLSATMSVFQITAIRAAACTLVFLALCLCRGISLTQPRFKLPRILARSTCAAAAFLCQCIAAVLLPLSDAAFMSNSYPVVTAVMSRLLRLEQLPLQSWLGVTGCLVGDALVAHPPFLFGGHEDWGAVRVIGIIVALCVNLLLSAASILLKWIGKEVSPVALTAWMHGFCVVLSLPFLAVGFPQPVHLHMSPIDGLYLAASAFVGMLGQSALIRALQIGPPTRVMSLATTSMLFATALGYFVLSEALPSMTLIGGAVVVISVILVTSKPVLPRLNLPQRQKYIELQAVQSS